MPPIAIVTAITQGSKLPSHRAIGGRQSQAERSDANATLEAEHSFLSCTESQLCLALTIQRSKPADISTRGEYCLRLRKHVKQGKPTAPGEHRYIDTVEFWKDQYSKVHSEKKTIEALLAQLEVLTDQNRSDDRAAVLELCSLGTANGHQPETSFGDAGSADNLPLLKQALMLHRLLRDDKVSTDILASAIQSSLSYMNFAIAETCETNSKEPNETGNNANHASLRTFDTVAAIFNICLKGLTHLCRDIPGRRCKGQVIFPLVQFFAPNISNRQDRASQKGDHEDTTRTLTLISGLTKFLANILTCPDFQKANLSHVEVLEGMFSALLEEVGRLISQIIFNEHISTLREPAPVSWSDSNTSATMNAVALDLKCRHLSIILKRAIKGRSEKDLHSLATMLAGTKVLGIGASGNLVLARARQRLQETLLKGIFGDDGEEFINALQMPESEEGWDSEAPQIARDEKEAFVELVWSTVGWEMMLND